MGGKGGIPKTLSNQRFEAIGEEGLSAENLSKRSKVKHLKKVRTDEGGAEIWGRVATVSTKDLGGGEATGLERSQIKMRGGASIREGGGLT